MIFGQECFRSVAFVIYLTDVLLEVRMFLKLRFNLRVNSEAVTLYKPLYKFFSQDFSEAVSFARIPGYLAELKTRETIST